MHSTCQVLFLHGLIRFPSQHGRNEATIRYHQCFKHLAGSCSFFANCYCIAGMQPSFHVLLIGTSLFYSTLFWDHMFMNPVNMVLNNMIPLELFFQLHDGKCHSSWTSTTSMKPPRTFTQLFLKLVRYMYTTILYLAILSLVTCRCT